MNNNILGSFLLVLAFIVIVILGTSIPEIRITNTYFDGALTVVADHADFFSSDSVSFTFTQPGDYVVTIMPIDSGDKVPNSFTVGLTPNEVPFTQVVSRYSITDMRITISDGTHTETHEFIEP